MTERKTDYKDVPNTSAVIVVTTPSIEGKRVVRTLGLVRGGTIRARHFGQDIMARLRSLVGGEIHEYADLLGKSRDQALDRMIRQAEEFGANAVLNVRFTTVVMMRGAAEIMAYGTAVVVEPETP
ncbi:MAG: YbjQ family protein [Chloroflexi bacterium]|nr:YbjQ family protein [Chloroflexota bacterium]MCY3937047.1 YbjQ family protein [Chloroflexota bacterium]